MKKLLAILVLNLLLISSSANAGSIGTGPLTLSPGTANWFIKYIKLSGMKKPAVFVVSTDGRSAYYWQCPHGNCMPGNHKVEIQICETKYKTECAVFAVRRTVRWSNGINTGKGKASRFLSKWSDEEIKAKLRELGFLGGTTSTTITPKKEVKKKKKKKNDDIVKKLKDLQELYDSGALTKEEYTKAKAKLLN